jgi:kynurenine formamidase
MRKFVELSHPLQDGMQAYPGLPNPKIGALFTHAESRSRYEGRAEFYIGKIELACNVGTYLDSPFHRYPDGADLSQIPLEAVAGLQGIVLEGTVSSARAVFLDCSEADLEDKAVLVRTGWDARWGTESYWEPGPHLSDGSIELLVRAKPKLVGVDFWNVDDPGNLARPAHTRLLAASILIIEHMCNLVNLPHSGFTFYAVPLRIVRGASFPVRAFAEVGK